MPNSNTSDEDSDLELDQRIDLSIRRTFAPPSVPNLSFLAEHFNSKTAATPSSNLAKTAELAMAVRDEHNTVGSSSVVSSRPIGDNQASVSQAPSRNKLRLAMIGLAAAITWIVVGSQFYGSWRSKNQTVAFQPRPLTELYQACVADGFRPYWVCEDEQLFASTFKDRQGVALNLQGLPASSKMVGLSYLLGISRQSTSVLAMTDDSPIIVFVDRLENDRKIDTGYIDGDDLHVTRIVRDDLVFYEVSPLPNARITPYLLPSPK